MKNMDEAKETLVRVGESILSWDMRDQFIYMLKLTELVDLANVILAKYDGRNERLNDLVNMLKEGKDDTESA